MQRTLLILLFAASYLLLAGGAPWTLGALLGLAAVAALASPVATFTFRRQTRHLDLALIALVAAVGVQLLPLPAAIVATLSPHAATVAAAVRLTPLGVAPSAWATLSVNPDATAVALGTVALGVMSFWIARTVFSAGGGTRVFCRALAFIGALAAALAVMQKAVAPRTVLFLVVPEARSASPFGAFVNRNHFAAWLLMVAAPVAGYCVARLHIHPSRQRHWRGSLAKFMSSGAIFTTVAALGMVGVLLLTLSRSALAGLGSAALVGRWLGQPRLRLERTSGPALLGLAGAVVLMVVLFVDVDGWATRIGHTFDMRSEGFSRLTIWRESIPILRDFWLTGSGAGTYSDAMTVYQQTRVWVGSMQRWAHFNNAHSFYLQVASEGGLLLSLPALWIALTVAVLGWRSVRADKGEMFWVRVGAFAGLAGLAVQSVWEVALVMPANAALAGMLAALLLYQREVGPRRSPNTCRRPMSRRHRPREWPADHADRRAQRLSRRRRRRGAAGRQVGRRARGRTLCARQARRRLPGASHRARTRDGRRDPGRCRRLGDRARPPRAPAAEGPVRADPPSGRGPGRAVPQYRRQERQHSARHRRDVRAGPGDDRVTRALHRAPSGASRQRLLHQRHGRRRSVARSTASAISSASSIAEGRGGRMTVIDRVFFPHSLGMLYLAITQYLGFKKFGDEYKVMGLAPYGTPAYADPIRQLVTLESGGRFRLDLDYFRHWTGEVADELGCG